MLSKSHWPRARRRRGYQKVPLGPRDAWMWLYWGVGPDPLGDAALIGRASLELQCSQRDFCIAPASRLLSVPREAQRLPAFLILPSRPMWEPGRILTRRNTFPAEHSTSGNRLNFECRSRVCLCEVGSGRRRANNLQWQHQLKPASISFITNRHLCFYWKGGGREARATRGRCIIYQLF